MFGNIVERNVRLLLGTGTGGPMLNEVGSASFGKYNITALEDILACKITSNPPFLGFEDTSNLPLLGI
jgi:hypothetical protein